MALQSIFLKKPGTEFEKEQNPDFDVVKWHKY